MTENDIIRMIPNAMMDDRSFNLHIERLRDLFDNDEDKTADAIIEWMVENGWSCGISSGQGWNEFWPPGQGDTYE